MPESVRHTPSVVACLGRDRPPRRTCAFSVLIGVLGETRQDAPREIPVDPSAIARGLNGTLTSAATQAPLQRFDTQGRDRR
jgi:hypothetical protein